MQVGEAAVDDVVGGEDTEVEVPFRPIGVGLV